MRGGWPVLLGMACISVVMASRGGGAGGGGGGRQSPRGQPRSSESASRRSKLWINLKDDRTQTAVTPKKCTTKTPAANIGMELGWGLWFSAFAFQRRFLRFRIAAFQCDGFLLLLSTLIAHNALATCILRFTVLLTDPLDHMF